MSKVSGRNRPVVAVLAGRRIDPNEGSSTEFPMSEIARVRTEIAAALKRMGVDLLVGSAACGTDILGLQAAEAAGVKTRIVLPFEVERFRQNSVTDRPGDWAPEYDRLVANAAKRGDLDIVDTSNAEDPYLANNLAVMAKVDAARPKRGVGIFVWNGIPKGPNDATANLQRLAKQAGFELVDISPRAEL